MGFPDGGFVPVDQLSCTWLYEPLATSADVCDWICGIQLPWKTAFGFFVSAVKSAKVPETCPYASAPPATRTRRAAAATHLRASVMSPLRLERGPARSRRA